MNSSNSAIGASPPIAPPTRSYNVLLADGSWLRITCRDLAVQLRQERNATLKRLRQARADALADVADRVVEARIRRQFEAAEREMDAAIRRLSKQVRIRPEPRRSSSSATPGSPRSSRPGSARASHPGLTAKRAAISALARRDSLGREGIMLRIRYVRAGGKHASVGCLRRHYRYIAREAAVTLDRNGEPIVLGNMGVTVDEVADALDLQEQLLRGMRKNAKLGFRAIGAFPYGMPVEARREALQRIGDDLFGARGLPWTAAAHDSDPGADVDNPHFHLDYGLLPMARQPDGTFIISNDLRTDLDGQEGLRFIRHTVARVMTEVAQEYGLDRTFTALSYRERGMDRDGGEHVGREGTAAHRRGEHVAAIARNDAKERLAEARDKARRARERLEALEQLKHTITATETAPVLDAAPVNADIGIAVAMPAAPVVTHVIPVVDTLTARPAPIISTAPEPVTTLTRQAPRMSGVSATDAAILVEAPSLRLLPGDDIVPAPHAPATIVPPISAAGNVAPSLETLPIVQLQPAAPSLSSVPPLDATSSAIDYKAAPIVAVPPEIVILPHRSASMESPPIVAAIGSMAPVVEPITMLTAVDRREVEAMTMPPAINRLGAIAPRLSGVPSLWDIGRPALDDPGDSDTVKRIDKLLEHEQLFRRDAASVQLDVNAVHAAAFEALRLRDEWLGQDNEGRYTVSEVALRATGLSRADLLGPEAQAALETIGFDQADRLDAVVEDRSGLPTFHINDGNIRLDDRFPIRLQEDVARWSGNPHFRAFVARVWPQFKPALEARPPVATVVQDRGPALSRLFAAIADERHFLVENQGVPTVDPALLARFGLSPADVGGEDARRRLDELASRQNEEVSQIAVFVSRSRHHIVPDGDGWLLDDAAPSDIRRMVLAWRNDRTVQAALGRFADSVLPVVAATPAPEAWEGPAGSAWQRARAYRDRTMADWDAMERLDGRGMARPGAQIERPGAAPNDHRGPAPRRLPPGLDHALGD